MGKRNGFLPWHFLVVPKEVLKGVGNFLLFNFHFFSTGLLLKTLFTPWKRQRIDKEKPGFSFQEYFTVLTFNLISRGIGAFIRAWFILVSLVFEAIILIFGLFIFILAILTPVISLPSFLSRGKGKKWSDLIIRSKKEPLPFVLAFLKSPRGQFLFYRLGVKPETVEQELLKNTAPQSLAPFEGAFLPTNTPSEIFSGLSLLWAPLNKTLTAFGLDLKDIEAVLAWFDHGEEKRQKEARFWEKENLMRKRALGVYWSYGYTLALDQYSTDFTQEQAFASHLVGRDEEVSRMETILSRSGQSNVLLIGEEGVGKRTVVFQLAENIRQGKVYPTLKHKRVLEVNINKVIGESKTPVEAQNKFEDILKEAVWAGNIILIIPNFDRFVSTLEGRIDLTPVFGRTMEKGKLQVIGISTPEAYQKYLYPNPVISKLFSKVEVNPPDKKGAIEILETFASQFEKEKKILITYQAIKEAVLKSDRYISDIPFPEKAIDLLDETAVAVEQRGWQGKGIITAADVDSVLSLKIKVPVGEIAQEEKEKLLDLENIIHKRLINQEQAVSDLANAFRRTRLRLGKKQKPAGVFLFLGPTGVGKTETAKALAEAYFGSENRLARLDMNEFQDSGASVRLLGDFASKEPGVMAKLLRENPFCVLLLDEIEKASPQVLNLFLTAFDEGYLTDNFGKKVSLTEMIIVCTSNAGSEFIRQRVGAGSSAEDFKKELIEYLLQKGIFSPEWLNRFDSVVVYRPLTFEHLKQIAVLMLKNLNENLKEREISLKITESLLEQIATQGNDPTFGARPMRRLIQDKIEAPLAQRLLRGEIKKGEEVEISL